MSAPLLWIILPLLLAGLLLFFHDQKFILLVACLFTLFLTLAAWLLPIETALTIQGWTFKLTSSIVILGRNLTLSSSDRSLLAFIYGSTFFWFIPAVSLQTARRLVPLGLAITSLLVAALSVEPTLYAALLFELAVLLSIPLLAPSHQAPSKGVIRYLIFETMAVPFILFSGWLLVGIGANPGNLDRVQQAATLLGFGFAFLLAIFPFFTWIPMLAEDSHPYIVGFLLWILPTATTFYGLGFLDHYTWLRDAPNLPVILSTAGALMIVFGGLLSAFQRNLGRIMGYAIIVEIGFSLLALKPGSQMVLDIFLLLLVPRTLCICLWALSLSVVKAQAPGLNLEDIKGLGRTWPFASATLVLANIALAGMPLLAGFPGHLAVWLALSRSSLSLTFWVLIGSLGILSSAIRVLAALTYSPAGMTWGTRETPSVRFFLIIGLAGLILLGLFPQWALLLWTKLPAIFEHLGQ